MAPRFTAIALRLLAVLAAFLVSGTAPLASAPIVLAQGIYYNRFASDYRLQDGYIVAGSDYWDPDDNAALNQAVAAAELSLTGLGTGTHTLHVSNAGGMPGGTLQLFGYVGDGSIAVSDRSNTGQSLSAITIGPGGNANIDVSAFVNAQIAQGTAFIGFLFAEPTANTAVEFFRPSISSTGPPTVTNPTVTGVTVNSATLGGTVAAASPITERGVVIARTATNSDPVIGGPGVARWSDATSNPGVFTKNVTGLAGGTSWSFKAFAVSSAGTVYSTVSTFNTLPRPSVSTPTVANITPSSATLGGNVTSEGGGPITERGVVYSITTQNANPVLNGLNVMKVTSPGTTGVFTVIVTGLAQGTGYSFKAYATNGGGTTYTGTPTFTTLAGGVPTVVTPTSANITTTSATLGGNVTSDGGLPITARGVVYSLTSVNDNPILGGPGVTPVPSTGTGTTGVFTVNAPGLTGGKGYSFKAYATNSAGTTYTTPASTFTTLAKVDVVGIEVVQSVQDLRNSVPLVAGKTTRVRVCVNSRPPALRPPFTAELRGFRNGVEFVDSPLPAAGRGSVFAYEPGPGVIDAMRALDLTLNFYLPDAWTSSGVTELRLDPDPSTPAVFVELGEPGGVGADGIILANFQEVGRPDIRLYHVEYTDNNVTYDGFQAFNSDGWEHIHRFHNMYPMVRTAGNFLTITSINVGNITGLSYAQINGRILVRMREVHRTDGSPNAIYFGLVDVGPTLLNGWGTGEMNGNVGWGGLAEMPRCVGYSLGRANPAVNGVELCTTGVTPLQEVPYVTTIDGQTVPALGPMDPARPEDWIYGWDLHSTFSASPESSQDMMGLCPVDSWISKFTYEALRAAINSRFPPPPPPAPPFAPLQSKSTPELGDVRDMFLINGSIRLSDGSVTLETVLRVSLPDPGPPLAGSHRVQLLDASGEMLSDTPFEPIVPVAPSGGDEMTLIDLLIPVEPGTAQIVIRQGGVVRASRLASANAPTVTVQSPNGGETLSGNTVTIAWTANDADNDALKFTVQYSADNGDTWNTLDTSLSALSLQVSHEALPASTTARIRVLASDGFHTSSDVSDAPFTVTNNPPRIFVRGPANQSVFTGQSQIFFQAMAFDREDGGGLSNITWTSNLDGILGTGFTLVRSAASLSVGTHLISATITDASGSMVSQSFYVQIARYRQLGVEALKADASTGRIGVLLNGDRGTPYQIEGSPDLQTWTTLETGTMSSVIREFRNPPSANSPPYFWRARQ